MAALDGLREAIHSAVWDVMHGAGGQLLTGDFYPGHDAIVDAATTAAQSFIEEAAERAILLLREARP